MTNDYGIRRCVTIPPDTEKVTPGIELVSQTRYHIQDANKVGIASCIDKIASPVWREYNKIIKICSPSLSFLLEFVKFLLYSSKNLCYRPPDLHFPRPSLCTIPPFRPCYKVVALNIERVSSRWTHLE